MVYKPDIAVLHPDLEALIHNHQSARLTNRLAKNLGQPELVNTEAAEQWARFLLEVNTFFLSTIRPQAEKLVLTHAQYVVAELMNQQVLSLLEDIKQFLAFNWQADPLQARELLAEITHQAVRHLPSSVTKQTLELEHRFSSQADFSLEEPYQNRAEQVCLDLAEYYYLKTSQYIQQIDAHFPEILAAFLHSLKNMLTALSLRLYLYSVNYDDNSQNTKAVTAIESILSRMAFEVNTLSEVDNILIMLLTLIGYTDEGLGVETLYRWDLHKVIQASYEQITPMYRDKDINFSATWSAKVPPYTFLYSHGYLVGLLFSNLYSNACKYVPHGGQVHAQTEMRWEKEKLWVRFRLTNDSKPIADQALPHVFEHGYRANNATGNPGEGIGLHLVQKIVEILGGWIEVSQSEPDHQTGLTQVSFSVYLPHYTTSELATKNKNQE